MTDLPASGDTIAALSTAAGPAGRAILRLSGPDALRIAATLTTPPPADDANADAAPRARPALLRLPDAAPLPCTLVVHRAPRSFTREDVVELHVPGSPALCRAVLDALFSAGARPAAAGEFTLRAFLNGRIDLARAEAVAGVIASEDPAAARAALRTLQGRVSTPLAAIESALLDACATLEGAIDFADQDTDVIDVARLARDLRSAALALAELSADCRTGPSPSALPRVVLLGPPNAGKTTLFNALAGRDAAIAAPEAGTTRDLLRAEIRLGTAAVELWDSPGVTGDDGLLARTMTRRSLDATAGADLVLFVADATRVARDAPPCPAAPAGVPEIRVLNKIDLVRGPSPHASNRQPETAAWIAASALRGDGLDELRALIADRLGLDQAGSSSPAVSGRLLVSARQAERLAAARQALATAVEGLETRGTALLELTAEEVRAALRAIGEITGREVSDAVLSRIFERFCIGK